MASDEFVILGTYSQTFEAEIVKSKLESEGIAAFIVDENIVGMNWLYSNAIGGVKVKVRTADLDQARAIVENKVDLDQAFEDETPTCPRCQSKNSVFQRISGPLFLISMMFALPLPVMKRRWRCQDCKHSWHV